MVFKVKSYSCKGPKICEIACSPHWSWTLCSKTQVCCTIQKDGILYHKRKQGQVTQCHVPRHLLSTCIFQREESAPTLCWTHLLLKATLQPPWPQVWPSCLCTLAVFPTCLPYHVATRFLIWHLKQRPEKEIIYKIVCVCTYVFLFVCLVFCINGHACKTLFDLPGQARGLLWTSPGLCEARSL